MNQAKLVEKMDAIWHQPRQRNALIAGAFAILIFLSLPALLGLFINQQKLKERLTTMVSQSLGLSLYFEQMRVNALSGSISLRGVALTNPASASQKALLGASEMVVRFSGFTDLMKTDPQPVALRFNGAKIRYYQQLNTPGRKISSHDLKLEALPVGLQVEFTNSSIEWLRLSRDFGTQTIYTVPQINVTIGFSPKRIDYRSQLLASDIPLMVEGQCSINQFVSFDRFDAACQSIISGEGLKLTLSHRSLTAENQGFTHRLTAKMTSADARPVLDIFNTKSAKAFSRYFSQAVSVSGDVEAYLTPEKKIIAAKNIEMPWLKGQMQLTLESGGIAPKYDSNLQLEIFDADIWRQFTEAAAGGEADLFAFGEGFSQDWIGTLALRSAQVKALGYDWQDFSANGRMANGVITITRAAANLDKVHQLVSLGQISSNFNGMQYNGVVEMNGISLLPFIRNFVEEPQDKDFANYRFRTNLILRPDVITLSETRLLFGKASRLVGGVNYFYNEEPNIRGKFGIQTIDFTPFIERWKRNASLFHPVHESPQDGFKFQWLKKAFPSIRLDLFVDQYRLFGLSGAQTQLTLQAKQGRFEATDINARLEATPVKGSIAVLHSLEQSRPSIQSELQVERLNIGTPLATKIFAQADTGSVWGNKPITFYPLYHFDGSHFWTIDTLRHDKLTVNNLRTRFEVNDQTLKISAAEAYLWDGLLRLNGQINAQMVTDMLFDVQATNLQFGELLKHFPYFEGLQGPFALSGKISTNGLSMLDWVQNAAANVTLRSDGFITRNFNLSALANGVAATRTVASLPNIMRVAWASGATRFANLQAVIQVKDSLFLMQNARFKSLESDNQLDLQLDLNRLQLDILARFGITQLHPTDYPTLAIRYRGDMGAPVRATDTQSLEAFIARK